MATDKVSYYCWNCWEAFCRANMISEKFTNMTMTSTLPVLSPSVQVDDYDPTKAEFIQPATEEEVVSAHQDMLLRQIARLQTRVARAVEESPTVAELHYNHVIEDLRFEAEASSPAL